ncbi:hypothetical protein L3Q82_007659 [Scortum barcoo]|uniref:Uncharacterized protein n=1 Tax=Scortum barcoo TaxID=214431 RepID=A0ACB8WNM2_9TELE|nr:hypothetical protein L3Q82_007659 [Scortum barcoo]
MAAELGSYKQAHTSSPPLTLGNSRVVEGPAPLKELGSRAQAMRGEFWSRDWVVEAPATTATQTTLHRPLMDLPAWVVSLLEGGPTSPFRAEPGRVPWAKTRPPGARLRAPTPGLAPGWGPGPVCHGRPYQGRNAPDNIAPRIIRAHKPLHHSTKHKTILEARSGLGPIKAYPRLGPKPSPEQGGELSSDPNTQERTFHCEICNVRVNSELQLKQHISSRRHRDGVAGKPNPLLSRHKKRTDFMELPKTLGAGLLPSPLAVAAAMAAAASSNQLALRPPGPTSHPHPHHHLLQGTPLSLLRPAPADRMLMNHTEVDLFSCNNPSVVAYRYFAVLWGCAVTVTGTVGNLMTILAFALDPRLRTHFNVLIVNLAAADLLHCTILPISVDSYLHLRWRSGQLWCSIFGLLLFLSNSVSIITLCLVAVSRYLLVAKRAVFERVFSDRGLILLLILTWALGVASFAPLWSVYTFVPQVCTCSFHRTRGRPYTTVLLFFYFFVGLGCVGVFYLLIYRRVRIASQALLRYRLSRRSSRKKPASSAQGTYDSGVESTVEKTCCCEMSSKAEVAQNTDEITCENSSTTKSPPDIISTPPTSTPASTNAASLSQSTASGDDKDLKHVTRMCFTVFLCFVFCFVPFMLLNIADRNNRAPQGVSFYQVTY